MNTDDDTLNEIALAGVEVAIRNLQAGVDAALDKFQRDVKLAQLTAEKARLEATLCLCHPAEASR